MLVPNEPDSYAQYKSIRSNLALDQKILLPLQGKEGDSRKYGLHPSLSGLKSLFESGELAFLNNVGTLLEPYDKGEGAEPVKGFPLGLYSHSDQIGQWQTALSDDRSLKGWGGRLTDLLQTKNPTASNPMAYAVDTTSVFLSGKESNGYTISKEARAPDIPGYQGTDWKFSKILTEMIDKQLAHAYSNILTRTLAQRTQTILKTNATFSEAISRAPQIESEFYDNKFSQSMKAIAQTIAAREQLGMNRQLFYIVLGGWDHHDNLLEKHAEKLTTLDKGITAFQQSMQELRIADKVTTFTMSDFARTLTSNGNGSDHGWGGHQFIVGGAVNGGRMFGDYPSLQRENNPLLHDPDRVTFIPTTATDEYFAELALWFGVSLSDLAYVLPNINRFFDSVQNYPIGFLNS